MTGAMWKKIVLEAAQTVWSNPWLTEEIVEIPKQDVNEAVNVILEVLPELNETEIEQWMERLKAEMAEPTVRQLQSLAVKLLDAKTDEQWDLIQAQILEMALQQMDSVHLITTNPSYNNRD